MSDKDREKNKLQKKLRRLVGQAVFDYRLIEENDRIMVCLSGGKDSYTLLDILQSLQRNAPVEFSLFVVNLDQKQPDFPANVLPRYLDNLQIEYHIVEEDTYSIVKDLTPTGKTFCPICSRLRRGILYTKAKEFGATKIALGHHADDAVETLFLNMFYGGKMKTMPPKLVSDDGAHVVIRPLYYVRESDIVRWNELRQFPIIPCNLCGTQTNLQRNAIKGMLTEWEKIHPGRTANIARAMRHVTPSHMADNELHDFRLLQKHIELMPVRDISAND